MPFPLLKDIREMPVALDEFPFYLLPPIITSGGPRQTRGLIRQLRHAIKELFCFVQGRTSANGEMGFPNDDHDNDHARAREPGRMIARALFSRPGNLPDIHRLDPLRYKTWYGPLISSVATPERRCPAIPRAAPVHGGPPAPDRATVGYYLLGHRLVARKTVYSLRVLCETRFGIRFPDLLRRYPDSRAAR